MEHLDKTMTEYVFQEGIPSNTDSQFADKVMAYANLISETLNPSMFVPAVFEDGKWVILEEPENETEYFNWTNYNNAIDKIYFEIDYKIEKCISKEITEKLWLNNTICIAYKCRFKNVWVFYSKTIEDLIPYKLKLTQKIQNRLKWNN